MAKVRMRELRALSTQELCARLVGARRALWEARLKATSGALPQTHHLRQQRRLIARLETLTRQQPAPSQQPSAGTGGR